MDRARSRVLLLAGVLAVVAIGLTAWISGSDPRDALSRPATHADRSADEALVPVPSPAGSSRETTAAVPAKVESARNTVTSGRLRIHCVDETTGQDIPGLTWVVASERGGDKLHATGVADEHGRASVEDLPENTLLVFTLRKPPHAQGFTAVWLGRGETKDVDLRVGAGARVQGRVIDDLTHPIENAEVLVVNDYASPFLKYEDPSTSKKVAARTDAEGHYVIENVATTPRGVWVVDGAVRPESWGNVVVTARLENATGEAMAPIQPGETKDLPDIVLPRLRTWRGHVVDNEGRGVEGALLSVNWRRGGTRFFARDYQKVDSRPPGSEGFVLLPGETLTQAGGAFEISSRRPPQFTYVITPFGIGHKTQLPALEPGTSADDVLIKLKVVTGITLELVDPAGQRVRIPNPRVFPPDSNTSLGRRRFLERLRLVFSMANGAYVSATLTDDGAGGFVAQVDGRIDDARSYSLVAQGWAPVSAALSPPLRDGERLRIQLADQPCVRVHLRLHGRMNLDDSKSDAWVSLHACLLTTEALNAKSMECCGLGSSAHARVVDGERDILLPVETRRPFHVYTMLYVANRPGVLVDQGMFAPDGDVLTLEYDAADVASPAQKEPTKEPPPVTPPGVTKDLGSLRATIVDAATGRPVPDASIFLESPDHKLTAFHHIGSVGDRIVDDRVQTGHWLARASAKRYRTVKDIVVDISEGQTTDLGRIALEPAPITKFVILESDGTPIRQFGGWIRVCDADGGNDLLSSSIESQDGTVLCYQDVPDRVVVQVTEDDTNAQWIQVRRDPDATVVRLAAWRDVDVRVVGAAMLYPGSNLTIRISPESMGGAAVDTAVPNRSRPLSSQPRELDVPANEPRLFHGRLGPGRYVVEGTSPLFKVSARSFEVEAGDGPVRVDVESIE